MKKPLLAVLGALVVGLAILVPASPAHALNHTPAACADKSGFGYDVTVCAQYGWRMQNDGTGVYVENVNIYTADGCGDLESKAFENILVRETQTGNFRSIGDQFACSVVWDLEIRGPDGGNAVVNSQVGVNVDAASDFVASLICDIRPSNPDDCQGFIN